MKKNHCFIVALFHCLLAIVFVSLLISHFSPPVYACESNSECGQYLCVDHVCTDLLAPQSSSLEKFQTIVKKAEEKGETNLQWYLGSDNGTIEGITNSLTGLIVGNNIDWEQLHAGNFQNARIGGAYGFTANLVAQVLTQPPVSSREYFADLGKNFGIIKPAYAQGIGFKGLSNLLPLWKATRNLAYILFVIIFLITGLAIMFRVKLDPKTVVTIQNAIPKLIIALILVTFSYAIVGLLIDLIYLIIYLGVLALAGPIQMVNHSATAIADTQSKFTSLSFLEGIGLILGGEIQAISNMIGKPLVNSIFSTGGIMLLPTKFIFAVGIGALSTLIFAVIALFLMVKLLLSLLSSYIKIIISVIIAPLQIMMGVLPGSSMGFGSWFKNLLANVLVFPAVALFMLLGSLLTQMWSTGPGWTPPVLGFAGGDLTGIIGFAMLLLAYKIPDMVKAAFKMAKPVDYGTAIGAAFGPAQWGVRMAAGPVAARVLPPPPPAPGPRPWYWKVYDFGKGLKWWS